MTKAIDILRVHKSEEPSMWKEQAQWHVDNWGWLMHSTQIALNARNRMTAMGLSQKELAERIGCSQQYISLILKGKENLTLETISKLESALDSPLISHPQFSADTYTLPGQSYRNFLNDSGGNDMEPDVKTSDLVDGYRPLKGRRRR